MSVPTPRTPRVAISRARTELAVASVLLEKNDDTDTSAVVDASRAAAANAVRAVLLARSIEAPGDAALADLVELLPARSALREPALTLARMPDSGDARRAAAAAVVADLVLSVAKAEIRGK